MNQKTENHRDKKIFTKSLLDKLNPNDGVEQICEVLSTVYGGRPNDYKEDIEYTKIDVFAGGLSNAFARAFDIPVEEAENTVVVLMEDSLNGAFEPLVDDFPVTVKDYLRLRYQD